MSHIRDGIEHVRAERSRKIAWSAQNCIAYVDADNDDICLRSLYRRLQDGVWSLSGATKLLVPPFQEKFQPTFLVWADRGTELLVADEYGRVIMYAGGNPLGRMKICATSDIRRDDELSAIVGCYWLPLLITQQRVCKSLSPVQTQAQQRSFSLGFCAMQSVAKKDGSIVRRSTNGKVKGDQTKLCLPYFWRRPMVQSDCYSNRPMGIMSRSRHSWNP